MGREDGRLGQGQQLPGSHGVETAALLVLADTEKPDRVSAVEALREFRRQARITLGDCSIKQLIEEGRRF